MSRKDYEMLAASIHSTLQSVQASPAHAACRLEVRQALKLAADRIASGIEDTAIPSTASGSSSLAGSRR